MKWFTLLVVAFAAVAVPTVDMTAATARESSSVFAREFSRTLTREPSGMPAAYTKGPNYDERRLLSQLEAWKGDFSEYGYAVDFLIEMVKSQKTTIDDLRKKDAGNLSKIANLEGEIARLKVGHESLGRAVEKQTREKAQVNALLAEVQAQLAGEKTVVTNLNSALEAKNSDLDTANAAIKKLEEDLKAAAQQQNRRDLLLSEKDASIAALENQLAASRLEIDEKTGFLQRLDKEKNDLRVEFEDAVRQLFGEYSERASQLEERVKELQDENQHMTMHLASTMIDKDESIATIEKALQAAIVDGEARGQQVALLQEQLKLAAAEHSLSLGALAEAKSKIDSYLLELVTKEKDITQLKARVKTLESGLLTAKFNENQSDLKQRQAKKAVDDHEKLVKDLRNELRNKGNELQRWMDAARNSKSELEKLTVVYDKEKTEFSKEITSYGTEIDRLNKELRVAREQLETLQEELLAQMARLKDSEHSNEDLRKEAADLKEKIIFLNRNVAAVTTDLEEQKRQKADLAAENTKLDEKYKNLIAENDKLHEGQIRTWRDAYGKLESLNADLQEKIQKEQEASDNALSELVRLLKEKEEGCSLSTNEDVQTVSKFTGEIDQLRRHIHGLTQKLDNITKELENKKRDETIRHETIVRNEAHIKGLLRELETKQLELDTANASLAEAKTTLRQLQGSSELKSKDYNENLAKLTDQISKLNEELAKASVEISKLRLQNIELESKLEAANNTIGFKVAAEARNKTALTKMNELANLNLSKFKGAEFKTLQLQKKVEELEQLSADYETLRRELDEYKEAGFDNDRLRTEIGDLQNFIRLLETAKMEYQDQNEALQSTIDELRRLSGTNQKKLTDIVEGHREELEALTKEKKLLRMELENSIRDQQLANQRLLQKETELEESLDRIASLEEDLTGNRHQLNSLEIIIKGVYADLDATPQGSMTLQGIAKSHVTGFKDLSSKIRELTTTLGLRDTEIARLNRQLSEEVKSCHEKITQKDQEYQLLTDNLNSCKSNNNLLAEELREAERRASERNSLIIKSREDYLAKVDSLESALIDCNELLAGSDKNNEEIRLLNSKTAQSNETLQSEKEELAQRIKLLQIQLDQERVGSTTRNQELQSDLNACESKNKNLESQLTESNNKFLKENLQMSEELKSLKGDLTICRGHNSDISDKLGGLQRSKLALESQVATLTTDHETFVKDLNAKASNCAREVSVLREQLSQLGDQHEGCKNRERMLSVQLEASHAKEHILTEDLAKKTTEHSQASDQLAQLQAYAATYEETSAQLREESANLEEGSQYQPILTLIHRLKFGFKSCEDAQIVLKEQLDQERVQLQQCRATNVNLSNASQFHESKISLLNKELERAQNSVTECGKDLDSLRQSNSRLVVEAQDSAMSIKLLEETVRAAQVSTTSLQASYSKCAEELTAKTLDFTRIDAISASCAKQLEVIGKENVDLKQKVTAYLDSKEKLEEKVRFLAKSTSENESIATLLREKLSAANDKYTKFKASCDKTKRELGEPTVLAQKSRALQASYDTCIRDLNLSKERNLAISAKNLEYENQLLILQENLSHAKDSNSITQKALDDRLNELEGLKHKLSMKQRDLEAANVAKLKVDGLLHETKNLLVEKEARIQELSGEFVKFGDTANTSQELVTSLRTLNMACEERNEQSLRQIAQLKQDLAIQEKKCTEDLVELQSTMARKENQLTESLNTCEAARAESDQTKQRLEQVKQDLMSLTKELEAATGGFKHCSEDLAKATDLNNSLKSSVTSLRNELVLAQEELRSCDSDRGQTSAQLSLGLGKIAHLESEMKLLTSLSESLKISAKNHEDNFLKCDGLYKSQQLELFNLQNRVKELESENLNITTVYNSVNNECSRENSALTAKLQAEAQRTDLLLGELNELQVKFEETDQSLEELQRVLGVKDLDTVIEAIQGLSDQGHKFERILEELESEFSQQKAELASDKQIIANQEADLITLRRAKDQFQLSLTECKGTNAILEDNMRRFAFSKKLPESSAHLSRIYELEREKQGCTNELRDLESKFIEYKRIAFEEMNTKLANVEKQNEVRLEALRGAIRDKEQDHTSILLQFEKLQKEMSKHTQYEMSFQTMTNLHQKYHEKSRGLLYFVNGDGKHIGGKYSWASVGIDLKKNASLKPLVKEVYERISTGNLILDVAHASAEIDPKDFGTMPLPMIIKTDPLSESSFTSITQGYDTIFIVVICEKQLDAGIAGRIKTVVAHHKFRAVVVEPAKKLPQEVNEKVTHDFDRITYRRVNTKVTLMGTEGVLGYAQSQRHFIPK